MDYKYELENNVIFVELFRLVEELMYLKDLGKVELVI